MDARQVADGLFPCWCVGLWIMYLVLTSQYKDLLRVSKDGLISFVKFFGVVTAIRIFYLSCIAPDVVLESIRNSTDTVPWQCMLGVYWEDMCNALPLVILGRMMADKKWFQYIYALLIFVMSVTFGCLHAYEGIQAAFIMSFYIPFTMRMGQKHGLGTVMICHIIYDLVTVFTYKIIAGL
jgi:hypothetical protein